LFSLAHVLLTPLPSSSSALLDELTSYLARPQPEEEREAWVQSTFGDLKSGEVEESKKSEVVAKIVDQVKAFGEGSEKGESSSALLGPGLWEEEERKRRGRTQRMGDE
jgi:hypothetical protein